MEIVMDNPVRQLTSSGLRVGVGIRIRPFPQQRLDEPFGLAVGAWGIRPGAQMPDFKAAQQLGEFL